MPLPAHPGARTQEDAAEDPLAVLSLGLVPHYQLYFTHKLVPPLKVRSCMWCISWRRGGGS